MSRFTLERIDAIDGKQVFHKLQIDGDCQFDLFEAEAFKKPKYLKELMKIYSYMQDISELKSLPENKFKDITPEKENIKEYEFKSHNLRVYAIKQKNGKIIVLGGYKNNQKKDIKKFRSIKKRFLEKNIRP